MNIDMTNSSHQCPSPWTQISSPSRFCGSPSFSNSVIFTVPKKPYSQVGGRLTGYMKGHLDAFNVNLHSIENGYLDGESITHGRSPRKHIWSFASGNFFNMEYCHCPCESPITGEPNPHLLRIIIFLILLTMTSCGLP